MRLSICRVFLLRSVQVKSNDLQCMGISHDPSADLEVVTSLEENMPNFWGMHL
jgi:hypothetical protein